MIQFHQSLRNLMHGIIIYDTLLYPPYYNRTYKPFGFVPPVLGIRGCSPLYDLLYHRNVCGRESIHTRIFSINKRTCDSVHPRTFSRNVCVCTSARIYVCDSAIILSRNSVCLFVHACDSVSIHAHAPTIICACGGCSTCLSINMSKRQVPLIRSPSSKITW